MIRSAPTNIAVTNKASQAKAAESSFQDAENIAEQNAGMESGLAAGFPSFKKGFDLAQVPARLGLQTGLSVQCCAKGGGSCSCPKCKAKATEENEENEITRAEAPENISASTPSQAPTQSETEVSGQTQTQTQAQSIQQSAENEKSAEEPLNNEQAPDALIIDESSSEVSEGQMTKSVFLQQLRETICGTIGPVLATVGQTTEGCPYLNYWLDMYEQKSAAEVEATVLRYAPSSRQARTAFDYISIVTQRALRAAEIWARTGRLAGIPEGVPTTLPGESQVSNNSNGVGSAPAVMAKAKAGGAKNVNDPHKVQKDLGSGQPLSSAVRSRMESAFGTNFSHVRMHSDSVGSRMSDQLNARAFAVGNHVAFGSGEYQPGTPMGDALIAHELAHVIQQNGSSENANTLDMGGNGENAFERDADNAAVSVVSSLWGEDKKSGGLFQNTMPALRSGLRLQRCNRNSQQQVPPTAATPVLRKRTVQGPTPIDCGGSVWGVQWYLDNPGTTNGFIVQHVPETYNVTDCANNPIDVAVHTHGDLDPSWGPFWEAWEVRSGVVYVGTTTQQHNADTFGTNAFGPNTKGNYSILATAEYYPNATLPSGFVARNAAPAWSLPYTKTNPNLTGGTGQLNHHLTASWDCCPGSASQTTNLNTV